MSLCQCCAGFDPSSDVVTCKEGDQDPRWALYWKATVAGARDSQPCPAAINGVETAGFASRLCDTRGRWADEVDVTNCRSIAFQDLGNEAVSKDLRFMEHVASYNNLFLTGSDSE